MLRMKPVAAAAVAALGVAAGIASQHVDVAPISSSHAVTTTATGRQLPDFSALVEQAGPAVVNISTVQKVRTAAQDPGLDPNHPFHEFFRRFGTPPNSGPQVPERGGVGSGFIVSPDGYILTNAHVVANANEVTVRLTDKREFKAKVIGVDRRTDVALIKIEGGALPTVRIGNSSQTKVGEWVAAIGSPFGFENSVTSGIVSAKARSLPSDNYVPFLQTDVAVNPGNSGGPLFNMSGEVIGINSQIYSRTGGYMGLSFAIPIEVAMKVKDDLQKFGKVSRGRLGVTIQPISQDLAESFGLRNRQGALVNGVEPDSPAAKAGVVAGDVILSVNDRAVAEPGDLVRTIGEAKPGHAVTLKVWRKGATREFTAKLVEMEAEKSAAAEPVKKPGKLGLTVRPLSGEEQKQLATSGGLVVEQATGAAATAGIAPGDVILAVNNEKVTNAEQLSQLADASKGSVAILVQRDKQRIYIPVRVG